jgi:hypothetical protein
VVLVALCLTLVLGVAVAGYVAVCARTMEMSNRSFCTMSATQLAESGVEEALWSLNNSSWSGWTITGSTATKSEDYGNALHFTTNQAIPGSVSITVDNYNTTDPFNTPPTITAIGTLTLPSSFQSQKRLKVAVNPAALFSNAVGSTAPANSANPPYYVYFTSGGSVDSYDSKPSAPNNGIYTPSPSTVNRSDRAIICGPYISIGDAIILGYAATANKGPATPPWNFYAPSISVYGSVTSIDSASGLPSSVRIDNNRISNNANQYGFVISDANLPGSYAGDISNLNLHDGSAAIGTPGGPLERYAAAALSLSGNDVLTINGPVIIDVSGNLTIQDSARIVVTKGVDSAPDGSAQIYVAGNLDIESPVYVADSANDTIRKITPAGIVTTLAGSPGPPGSADGTGSAARFYSPGGVAVDDAGNVYVADTGNNTIRTANDTIRKITPAGIVTTLAGSPGPPGSADGTGGTALFNAPKAVAVDSAGDVYVADTGNNTIREITPTGLVTTLAGSPGSAGSADGMGNAARFTQPGGLATYTTGNLYVADTGNDTIRKITPSGVVATLAGSVGSAGSADGTSAARFNSPTGLAVSRGGIKNLTQRPRNLTVFCNGSTQSTIDTSIAFYGAVYAPNSPLVVNVNLTVYGALVGQSVTFNGTPTIHYDLDLRKATFSVVNTPYDVWQWNVSN